jgi:phosphate transport system permease protein
MTTVLTQPPATDQSIADDQPRRLSRRNLDDRLSLWGSLLSAVALTWLIFYQVLPVSGLLPFVLLWFVTFLALYTTVTALGNPWPVVVDRFVSATMAGGAATVGLALGSTVLYTVYKGLPALPHVNFYVRSMGGVGPTASLTEGGVFHAIYGSLLELFIAALVATPLGIITAVYMTEVRGPIARVVRTIIEAMTALPDILAGLFIYVTLIVLLHMPKDGFAAAIALSVTMLPIIARATDVVLRVVPGGLREAGLALGATQLQTVFRVVLPTARPGLATALILGLARAVGETAPVLLTSGASTFLNLNPFDQAMNSLPLFIFSAVRSGQPIYIERGFGAATVLLVLVLVLFALTRWLARNKVGKR